MEDDPVDLGGDIVSIASLGLERARGVASILDRGRLEYARLVECRRRSDGSEVVVADLEVERPQRRANDIRAVERVGMTFSLDDRLPAVLSLRRDFPSVPHLNMGEAGAPKSLCLYDRNWSELKSSWTPARFIERIRYWLAETARGTLHGEDQPLEPLIAASAYRIIIPHDLFPPADAPSGVVSPLVVGWAGGAANRVLTAIRPTGQEQGGMPFVAVAVRTAPQTHGVIHHAPSTLNELHQFLSAAGCDLIGSLRAIHDLWNKPAMLQAKLLIVAACPKRRSDAVAVEAIDVLTFMTMQSVEVMLDDIGRRVKGGGYLLGQVDATELGKKTELLVVNTVFDYSREAAAHLNGLDAPVLTKIVAVGLGALGSKLQLCLARSGFGTWTLVDQDVLLPHNLARHQYTGDCTGWRKVDVALAANHSLFRSEPPPAVMAVSVLDAGDDSVKLSQVLAEAEVILDMSASVTVARHLAKSDSTARRVSVFLNPLGTELVLLAEDRERAVTLDALEFQLYRGLLNRVELEAHLGTGAGRVRYAASCRDVTSRVPDDQVSLLAAVGARAVRTALEDAAAQIRVWRIDPPAFTVSSVTLPVAEVERVEVGKWTMIVDEELKVRLRDLRKAKLPNETGGVLVGAVDHEDRCIYVVDTIPSPPDSKERKDLYIRGSEMLSQEMAKVSRVTAGNLGYLGEWHSHPEGYPCEPSKADEKVFEWLKDHMADEGQPALMVIVGDAGAAFFLG